MELFMEMATTDRHNRLSGTFFGRILSLLEKKEIYALTESGALAYYGEKKEPQFIRLIDINGIEDTDEFTKEILQDLNYVRPDFFMFKKNKYLTTKKGTRIAGYPDLIVEIWSDDNTAFDKKVKLDLYSSSPVTEHWYIEQDSDEVICYYGKNKTENQNLKDILVTRDGLQFDLRYLAL